MLGAEHHARERVNWSLEFTIFQFLTWRQNY